MDAHPDLVVAPGQCGVLQINKCLSVQLRAELEDPLGVPPPVEAEHHQVGHIGPSIICDRQPFVTLSPTGCQRRAITSITRVGQG